MQFIFDASLSEAGHADIYHQPFIKQWVYPIPSLNLLLTLLRVLAPHRG